MSTIAQYPNNDTQIPAWKIDDTQNNQAIFDTFTCKPNSYLSQTHDNNRGVRSKELDIFVEQTLEDLGCTPAEIFDILNNDGAYITNQVLRIFNEDEIDTDTGYLMLDDANKLRIKREIHIMHDYYKAGQKSTAQGIHISSMPVTLYPNAFSPQITNLIQQTKPTVLTGSYLSLKGYRNAQIDAYIEQNLRDIGLQDEQIVDFLAGQGYFYQTEMWKNMFKDEDEDYEESFDLEQIQKTFNKHKNNIIKRYNK